MAERLSTGFVDAVNALGSVKTVMANGVIRLFSGTQPTSANDTENGEVLMELSLNGDLFVKVTGTNGINMDLSTDGTLAKSLSEVWSGVGLAAAGGGTTATWYRWYDINMTTGADAAAVRVDGAIGTTTAYEMRMSNPTIVEDAPSTVSTFNYTPKRS